LILLLGVAVLIGMLAALAGAQPPPPMFCTPGSTFSFAGATLNSSGEPVSNVNVTVEVYEPSPSGPVLNSSFSALSNGTGFFNISSIIAHPSFLYKIHVRLYNATQPSKVDLIGPMLPEFPCHEVASLGSVKFRLKKAATLNITARGEEEYLERAREGASAPINGYHAGLEWLGETGQWAYLNTSGYLIILNPDFTFNSSTARPVMANVSALYYNGSGVFFAANTTMVLRFTPDLSNLTFYDISFRNYTNVTGLEYNPDDGRFYLSGAYLEILPPPMGPPPPPPVVAVDVFTPGFTLSGSINGSVPLGKLVRRSDGWFIAWYDDLMGVERLTRYGDDWMPRWEWTFNKTIGGIANNGSSWYYASQDDNNITSFQLSDKGVKTFGYYVKDTKLGYPVAEHFNVDLTQAYVYVPSDRNYSIEMFPNMAMPVSYELNNISSYGASPLIDIVFNITERMKWVSGYVSYNGSSGFEDLKVVPYLLEPGNMVFSGYPMPYNMSSWREPFGTMSDIYVPSIGFYNITLPGSAMGADMLLFVTARNGSQFYGGFQNITLYATSGDVTGLNLTLQPLTGSVANITMDNAADFNFKVNVTTLEKTFRLQNSTGTPPSSAFVEVTVNYTSYYPGSTVFSWMVDVPKSAQGFFSIPLLEADIKEMNIYSPDFAPLSMSLDAAELGVDPVVITLNKFRPGGINESFTDLRIDMLRNSPKCNVPYPPPGCSLLPREKNLSEFNPLTVVIGGGDINFRMKKLSNNITVQYNKVDLLASGPPDALFDSSSSQSSANGVLAQAWRFGSTGPEIYETVLLGVPYNESETPDESNFSVRLAYLYDEDWNVIWNISENSVEEMPPGYKDFLDERYNAYVNSSRDPMPCSKSDQLSTCYVNTTFNMIWMQIPHFSGVGPQIIAQLPPPSSPPGSQEEQDVTPPSSGGSALPAVLSGENVLLVANSIDLGLADEFLAYLRSSNIEARVVNATEFTELERVNNRLIIILGGPDAPEGVGEITREVLSDAEEAAVRDAGSQLMFVKYNVWTGMWTHNQVVVVLAGSDRKSTALAESMYAGDVKTRLTG